MTLGLLIADTWPDKRPARAAVERTLRERHVDDVLVFGDDGFVPGARHVPVAPLAGIPAYNALMLDAAADHLACDAYLVIQWDGFAIDGRRWCGEFLDHDYIGAPWWHRDGIVGAGGFSLRSRQLFEAVRELRRGNDHDVDTAEDLQICIRHRAALQTGGLRLAPSDLAAHFAFERIPQASEARPATFGFHGVFNFPLVLPELDILELFEALVPRIARTFAAWHLLVWHAWQRRYHTLGTRLLAALAEIDTRLWAQVGQSCLARGMSPLWLKEAR